MAKYSIASGQDRLGRIFYKVENWAMFRMRKIKLKGKYNARNIQSIVINMVKIFFRMKEGSLDSLQMRLMTGQQTAIRAPRSHLKCQSF